MAALCLYSDHDSDLDEASIFSEESICLEEPGIEPEAVESTVTFAVGDKFRDLQDKIAEYEKTNFIQVWKREARTLYALLMYNNSHDMI